MRRRARGLMMGPIFWAAVASQGYAQAPRDPSSALAELAAIVARARAAEGPRDVAAARAALAAWDASRTACAPADLPARPAGDVTREALASAAAAFQDRVRACAWPAAAVPFRLGAVERVTVTAEEPTIPAVLADSPLAAPPWTGAESLARLPGVAPQYGSARNERTIAIRGFSVRQVPVYVDGIPVYSPYDGGVDLGRYLFADVAGIEIARAFASPLYGANALGGAVNLLSREPLERFSGAGSFSLGSGEAGAARLGVAARRARGWVAGDVAFARRAYLPLASGRRANSDSRDVNARVKAGTRVAGADFVAGFWMQSAEKGTPFYDGANGAVQRRYWRWPRWGDRTAFAVASLPVSERVRLRARIYDRAFDNELHAFDDATFTSRRRASSFTSYYDDQTWGGNVEADVDGPGRHAVRSALSISSSTHREWNLGEPVRASAARTWSAAVEDRIPFGSRIVALAGVTADGLDVRRADDLRAGAIVPMPAGAETSFNPQGALLVSAGADTLVRVTVARRTRLPTLKERYSYRQGRAIPNPALREERAWHAELAATWRHGTRVQADIAAFASAVDGVADRVYLQPNLYQLQNVGSATHRGIDAAVRFRPARMIQANVTYAFLDRRLADASLKPIDTPRHRAYGSLVWTPVTRLSVMADVEYERGRWTQDDTGRYTRASEGALVAAGAQLALMRHADLRASVRNLLDRRSFLVEGFAEPGRTADVELRFRF